MNPVLWWACPTCASVDVSCIRSRNKHRHTCRGCGASVELNLPGGR